MVLPTRNPQWSSLAGAAAADRRHRLRKGSSYTCRWSYIFYGGFALVVLAVFGLGIWQMSALTVTGGGGGNVGGGPSIGSGASEGYAGDGSGRPRQPLDTVLRFVPSERMRRLAEDGGLDRLRSGRRWGVRPPKLALVTGGMAKDSKSLMLLTIVKSLMDLGYSIEVLTLENENNHILWQHIGCPVSTLLAEDYGSVDWANYEGVILNSLEGKRVISSLLAEPFLSVPVLWLIQEDTLGSRLLHYAELGWEDLIGDWRNAFSRADVVVFQDFSLPVLYTSLDTGNFFVISGHPIDIWATKNYISYHSRNQLRENYELVEDDIVILVVGSSIFYDELPWDFAAAMHALAPWIAKNARTADLFEIIKFIFLCGSSVGSYSNVIQEVARHMGFPDGSIRQYGLDHDLNGFLLMSDIVLYVSFQEEQSFPPALLQTMSFEIPIIAPNLTIIRKHVVDRVHAILYNPNEPESLPRALPLLIEDKMLSNLAHSIASQGKLLSMNMLASDCISSYAKLLENILQFPSDSIIPDSISQVEHNTWLWNFFDKESGERHNSVESESKINANFGVQSSSIVYMLEKQYAEKQMAKGSQIGSDTLKEDFPTQSDWDDINEMETSEELERREMEELDERMDRDLGLWEEVYHNARKAEKHKNHANERDEGELERTGESLCIYEVYSGEGAWRFLHHGSMYRGISLSQKALRPMSDDLDAVSSLPFLNSTYFRDILCELGAMFAIANKIDKIHKLPWIGFQSWRTAGAKKSLSSNAEEALEIAIKGENQGDTIYFWAAMEMEQDVETSTKINFWSRCDILNAAQCRPMFESAFRQMYGLPGGLNALPPIPSDGDRWSILHSWVMPTPSFVEFIMFSRMFVDSLDSLNKDNEESAYCALGSSMLENRHCYCRVLEILVNVWAYHSARRMVYLNPVSGELKEQHPLELRKMWAKYFNFTLLKSMDEDLAEEADDGMHQNNRWLWPLTGEVYWQGVLDREREDRYRRKMDKKRRTMEKLLERQKYGYKQKSLG